RRWCCQGFPPGRDLYEYVGFDGNTFIPVNTGPIPSFVQRTIASDAEWTTYTDEFGFIVRRLKAQAVSPTIYYYLKGSVNSREDWQAMKRRYDPRDIRRLPLSWSEELIEHYRTTSAAVGLSMHWGPGRGPKNGYMLGLEEFLQTLHDEPAFVHDIFDFWADFAIELWRPVVERISIDYVVFNEDGLAYKTSSLIGPEAYRKFWMPYVKRVIDFLRSYEVRIFSFYTSGNIEPLIPVLLETGFNLFGPLEVAAGMDAIKLRKQYGRDVLLYGNISRQALMDGPEAVEREVYSKVPWLMEQGGFIPAVDDMILPDISFRAFMRYVELIREMTIG
ncbi:MAG: uroporphyrinogen decarboxylase family protein, partial [Anaerolineae bacterium]